MKPTILISLSLGVLSLAAAQTGTSRQLTPEMRARMEKMRPVMDLSQNIRILPQLEKNKSTAMTKAQAAQLLPILKKLQAAKSIDPNDAKKYLIQIEDRIMTDQQLTALDDLQLKAEKERAARRTQAPGNAGNAQRLPGMPPGMGGVLRPGQNQPRNGQGGQAGQNGQTAPQNGPFNPFAQGPGADALKAYIAVLQKK